MEQPTRPQGRGRPPENAVILTTVAQERDDSEALFDAMILIFQGYSRLQDLQTRRGLRRQRWIPANEPVIRPAA